MDIIHSLILGIAQGITEFLPVSSSGHLVLMQKFFNIKEPPIFFDTLVHFATLMAVIFYLRKEILSIIKNINPVRNGASDGVKEKNTQKLLALIVLATIPAIVIGFLLKDSIEGIFNSVGLLAVTFLITALILFITKFFENGQKQMEELSWFSSLLVGVFQALAILPGVSRSASTISAGLFSGLKREEAFKFSFLLAIPVISGAMVLQLFNFNWSNLNGGLIPNFTGFFAAAISGFLSLKILEKITTKGKLHYFAIYCFLLGLAILIFNFL